MNRKMAVVSVAVLLVLAACVVKPSQSHATGAEPTAPDNALRG